MIARRGLQGAAGAAVLVAATFAASSSADALCAPRRYSGEATGIFATTTGIGARSDWRSEVRQRLGSDYALWSRARDKSTRCFRREGGRWECHARARPCNSP